jgi:hypothetical protein
METSEVVVRAVDGEVEAMDVEVPNVEMDLLWKTQKAVEMERALTATMRKVEPWLRSSKVNPNQPRVRPIPTSMEQVHQVLAVARNLASRTSAPAGWNPNAPVVGFTTPNPLPHQLRGGALAALQLERARQSERDKKRQREQQKSAELEQAAAAAAARAEQEHQRQLPSELNDPTTGRDPKRREVAHHEVEIRPTSSRPPASALDIASRPAPPQVDVSMNLSDSSSEDDDD